MSKSIFIFFSILFLTIIIFSNYAIDSQYLGYWENTNSNSENIARFYLNPGPGRNEYDIHVFEGCSGPRCDWDHTPLFGYGADKNSSSDDYATAIYREKRQITILTLQFMSDGRILLKRFTRFTGKNNNKNFYTYDLFVKVNNKTEKLEQRCPDLIVEKIYPLKLQSAGAGLTVRVDIKNIGNGRSEDCTARLTDMINRNPKSKDEYESIENVESLAPGESTTVTFMIKYRSKIKPKIVVEVDVDFENEVDECDENNNKQSSRNR